MLQFSACEGRQKVTPDRVEVARAGPVESLVTHLSQHGVGSARIRGALESRDEAIGNQPVHEPCHTGSAEDDAICQFTHAQSVALGDLELEEHVEFRQGQIAGRQLLVRGHVEVHALDADPAGAGEAVEDQVARPAQDAHAQADHLDFHRDLGVLVDPAARLDVEHLARAEHLLEDVAVAVEPQVPPPWPPVNVSMKMPVPPKSMLAMPLSRRKL
jgi:hypothetical protein